MTARSYSDLSDSATTFDPEEQFDRDIDEGMKEMSKEEAVNLAISAELEKAGVILAGVNPGRAAIAAAEKWDAEQPSNGECALCGGPLPCLTHSQFPKQDKPLHLLDMRGAFKGCGEPPFKAGDVFGNRDGK
jgi:hypothetical protein